MALDMHAMDVTAVIMLGFYCTQCTMRHQSCTRNLLPVLRSTVILDEVSHRPKWSATFEQQHNMSTAVQAEVEGKYAATLLLNSQRKEAAAAEKRLREQYEARLREKQMDLNAAMRKLQVHRALSTLLNN